MSLTARQAKFLECYARDPCAARAVRAAGYSQHKPSSRVQGTRLLARMLADVNACATLAAIRAELAATLEIDRAHVIGGIFGAIATARHRGDAGQVIRGWLAVAKLTGLDKPEAAKKPVLTPENAALKARLEALSDEDLLAVSQGRHPTR